MLEFGRRLRRLREERGLKQKELAAIMGTSESTISCYEKGKREPDFETLTKLADFFDVSIDYLLGKTNIRQYDREVIQVIEEAITEDKELLAFWRDLVRKHDLKIAFKEMRKMPPEAIRRVVRYIKLVETENPPF